MKTSKQNFLFIEVMQNGIVMITKKIPIGKSSKEIILSPQNKSKDLYLPYYPLFHDVIVGDLNKSNFILSLEIPWVGFVVLAGVGKQVTKPTQIVLKPGDFASLTWHDLRLLVRIGEDQKIPTIKDSSEVLTLAKKLKPQAFSFLFDSKDEALGLSFSLVASFFFFVCIVAGFYFRKEEKPRFFSELSKNYITPFVAPSHFESLPEILREKLNRTQLTTDTVNYYLALSQAFSGALDANKPGSFLLEDTQKQFLEEERKAREEKLKTLFNAQIQLEEKQEKKSSYPRVFVEIPTLTSLSSSKDSELLLHYIKKSQEVAKERLNARKEALKAFAEISEYNMNDYKSAAYQKNSTKVEQKELSKINVWNTFTDEQAMYEEARLLGHEAKILQSRLFSKKENFAHKFNKFIYLSPNLQASFLGNNENLDQLFSRLNANEYGEKNRKIIKEPIVGEIASHLVKNVVEQNRYALQLCYEKMLRSLSSSRLEKKGHMEWRWRINTNGAISDLNLLSTSFDDEQMVECIKQKIRAWKFPKPKRGSVEIVYPFSFAPARG